MKTLSTLATALALITPTAALANPVMHSVGRSSGFAEEEICYRFEYREQYVPGTSVSPGYVTNKRDKVEVPCGNRVGAEPELSQYPTRPSTNSNRPAGAVSGSGTKEDPWITPYPNPGVEPSNTSHYSDRTPVHLAHGYYPPYQAAAGPTIINNDRSYRPQQQQPPQAYESRESVVQGDTNSCASGTVLGALAGGAAGAGLASGNDLYWSIPLGMIGGAMVGCQLNGG